MTVTAPASLTKIKTEFGGPNDLSAYVRGGTYVAATRPAASLPDIPINTAVSETEAGLAISQFEGLSSFVGSYETYVGGTTGVTTTAPAGASYAIIELCGAGGGSTNAGGGAGGGYIRKTIAVTGGVTQISIDYVGFFGSFSAGSVAGDGQDTYVTANGTTYIGYGGQGGRSNWATPAQGGTTSGNGDVNVDGFPQNQNFNGKGGGYNENFFPRDTPNNPSYSFGAERGAGVFASFTGECPYNCGCVAITWY